MAKHYLNLSTGAKILDKRSSQNNTQSKCHKQQAGISYLNFRKLYTENIQEESTVHRSYTLSIENRVQKLQKMSHQNPVFQFVGAVTVP